MITMHMFPQLLTDCMVTLHLCHLISSHTILGRHAVCTCVCVEGGETLFLRDSLGERLRFSSYLVFEAEVCSTPDQELHHLKVTFLCCIKHSTPA